MTESSLFQGVRLLQNKHGRPDADVSSDLARLPHSSGSQTAKLTGLRGVEEREKVERLEGRMVNAKSQSEANRGDGSGRSSLLQQGRQVSSRTLTTTTTPLCGPGRTWP